MSEKDGKRSLGRAAVSDALLILYSNTGTASELRPAREGRKNRRRRAHALPNQYLLTFAQVQRGLFLIPLM